MTYLYNLESSFKTKLKQKKFSLSEKTAGSVDRAIPHFIIMLDYY